jgi:glycosyltransferase involved in cell wall biosynthesis
MSKLRILHVVTYMGLGGLETMLMNYYRKIDRDKIQFDFLVHRNEEAYYDKEIESLGGKIFHLPRLNPFSKSYKNALENFLLNHPEYKIIHVHQDCLSGVILKVAEECGVPVRIAHSHNSNQDKNLKYLIKLYYKRIIPKYSTHLFACGKKAGEWMFSGAKFDILNNAIEAEKYTFSQEKRNQMRIKLNIPDNKLVIGHVGRFSEPKNHSFLIKIFAEILKTTDALLLLVGDGELRPNIEAQAKQFGIY